MGITVYDYAPTEISETEVDLDGYVSYIGGGGTADCWFEYGLTNSYGCTSTHTELSAHQHFYASITGLSAGNAYHYRACASNIGGTFYGDDAIMRDVQTLAATSITATSVRLNAKFLEMQPDFSEELRQYVGLYFQWGTDTGYGNSTDYQYGLANGTEYYADITGLAPSTAYHFRAAISMPS